MTYFYLEEFLNSVTRKYFFSVTDKMLIMWWVRKSKCPIVVPLDSDKQVNIYSL